MVIDVLITSQSYLLAEGLSNLIEDDPEIRVTAIVSPPTDQGNKVWPAYDIILADYCSFHCLPPRHSNDSPRKVLLVPCQYFLNSGHYLPELISQGLVGIIQINATSHQLRKAIIKVHSGELWFDQKIVRDSLFQGHNQNLPISLTRKEKQILKLVCTGLTNREIANELCVCEQTVKTHCNHLFKKFGVSNRVKLALYATNFPDNHFRD